MSVSSLSSAVAGSSTATQASAQAASQNTVSKDQFLKLFVTQLKFQDPLNPMDSTGFTSQLAQFSSLEQLTNLNDGMKSLLLSQNSLQNALVTGLIGKQVGFQAAGAEGDGGALQYGTVTGVSFESNRTWFTVDGASKIAPADIKEIR